MLVVALTITELTAGMRYQARIAAHRERRAAALCAMSRELSGALTAEQIAEIAVQHVRGVFEAPATLLLPDRDGTIARRAGGQPNALPNVDCRWRSGCTIAGSRPGSAPTRSPALPIHYVPLRAPVRNRGVLALAAAQRAADLRARATAACSRRSPHRSRSRSSACTSSRSRRKPNSAWRRSGCATRCSRRSRTICARRSRCIDRRGEQPRRAGRSLSAEARRELTATIYEQAVHMSELTANVLDMARLETGAVQLNRQWHPFEEVVGRGARPAAHAARRAARRRSTWRKRRRWSGSTPCSSARC